MAEYLSGSYFEVRLEGSTDSAEGPKVVLLAGRFMSVSGLGMELEYETYNEGGLNYPRFFFKEVKPQVLTLQEGVVTDTDSAAELMGLCNLGKSVPLEGTVTLKDSFGMSQRQWNIVGAHLQKYMGPDLDANQAAVAVNRIELLYNGCY